jgi:hypothetical protein
MKQISITPTAQITAGNYIVSVGIHDKSEIAIFSKSSGKVCEFKNARYKGKLSKIKRSFGKHLCSSEEFYFAKMDEADVLKMIEILKAK